MNKRDREIIGITALLILTNVYLVLMGIQYEDNESFPVLGFGIFLAVQTFVLFVGWQSNDPAFVWSVGPLYIRLKFSTTPFFYIDRQKRKCTQFFEIGFTQEEPYSTTHRVWVFQFLTFAFHIGWVPVEAPQNSIWADDEPVCPSPAGAYTYTRTTTNMTPEMKKAFDDIFETVDSMHVSLAKLADSKDVRNADYTKP